ncbi:MAG TPA: prenyltransferase/squalene oxidase repeat-containing protein [Gemmataceae bacterium]|jgi:hypothetical protein|nr:prenyltransferase/squalene oxidase repeat-containing protein [Gemmataceae bacterium]
MRAGRRLAGVSITLILVLAASGRTADADAIKQAVDRGVAFLKSSQRPDGTWQGEYRVGITALTALTLLECDVDPADPVIQKAVAGVRAGSVNEGRTYEISLAIMLLDRLGEKKDLPFIESLTNRLVRGQNGLGGWSYNCPVDNSEAARLQALVQDDKDAPKRPGLPSQIGQGGNAGLSPVRPVFGTLQEEGDNSNTQFATLALWVARRHRLNADATLAAVEQRFRRMQQADGGWPYNQGTIATASMTCAGLLGLAVAYGVGNDAAFLRNEAERRKEANRKEGKEGKEGKSSRSAKPREPKDPNRDPAVRAGLVALGKMINGRYINAERTFGGPGPGQGAQGAAPGVPAVLPPNGPGAAPGPPAIDRTDYYFLWSLERVAMAYALKTIGKKDWYDWGTAIILPRQKADGSWEGYYNPRIDTSFALLFLRRSNLLSDLTSSLKGKVHDPFEVALRAGGTLPRNGPGESVIPVEKTGSIPKLKLDGSGQKRSESSSEPSTRSSAASGEDSEAGRLSSELVDAAPQRQGALIDRLRDSKGVVNTEALSLAIPRLSGSARQKARDALVRRLMRMTADTLRDKLSEDDLEIRRAAALACAMKEDKDYVPDLIKLLEDPEPPVARAAHAALKNLTKQDFGPDADASRAERAQAIERWNDWWSKNK